MVKVEDYRLSGLGLKPSTKRPFFKPFIWILSEEIGEKMFQPTWHCFIMGDFEDGWLIKFRIFGLGFE